MSEELPVKFDPAGFRSTCPEYSDTTKYPDEKLSGYFERAFEWMKIVGGPSYPYCLFTAHLLYADEMILSGDDPTGAVTTATIDKITVTMQSVPPKSQWQNWLSTTPRGKQLWAWLSVQSVGGWSVGGLPERQAFRKVGGVFW